MLVPDPGDQWLEVTAALVDVVTVVLVRPRGRVPEHVAEKLGARLRKRSAALVALGDWPRAEVRLTTREPAWSGVGEGHGHLRARRILVEAHRGSGTAAARGAVVPGRGPDLPPRRGARRRSPGGVEVARSASHEGPGRLVSGLAGGRRAGRRGAAHPPAGGGVQRQHRAGVQRRRPHRRRTPRDAPPRRPVALPRAPGVRRQPGPRRPRVRAGAGRRRGAAAGRHAAAAGAGGAARAGPVPRRRAGRGGAARRAAGRAGRVGLPVRRRRRAVHRRAGRPPGRAAGLPRGRAGGVGAVPARAAGRGARGPRTRSA